MKFSDLDIAATIHVPTEVARLLGVGAFLRVRAIDFQTGRIDFDLGVGQEGPLYWAFAATDEDDVSCNWYNADSKRFGRFKMPPGRLTQSESMRLVRDAAGIRTE